MSDVFKVFDDIDYKIIKLLKTDARMPVNSIAKELNIDVRTTKKRIDRLINSKTLRLTAIVDPKKFSYESVCDINLSIEQEEYQKVIKKLNNLINISYMAKGWGKENLTLQTRFKNNEEMLNFIENTLPNIKGVTVSSYILIPQIMHDIDHWMPDESDFNNSKNM